MASMLILAISVLALGLGPLLFRVADRARSTLLFLDGFVMVTISGLVLVHIIPHGFAVAGPLVLLLAVFGLMGPSIIERHLHQAARQVHTAVMFLACFGLMVHAFFDGVALGASYSAHSYGDEGLVLAIAIVLHRLPVAVTVWWLLRPSSGVLTGVLALSGLAVATVCGYGFAGALEPLMEAHWVAGLQALVAGSLLHVVFHRPPHVPAPSSVGGRQWHAGLGAFAGLAVVAVLADTHLPLQRVLGAMNFRETFLTLALASAPALLLGFVLAGMVQVFMPQTPLRWLRTGRPATESLRGVAFGLPLPICSCGVVPVYRSLVKKGVPTTAGMAFLIATPELGLDAVLISLPLLGGELTITRVIAAALVAFVIGIVVGGRAEVARTKTAAVPDDTPAATHSNVPARLRLGLRLGLGEVVDEVGPWILAGLVIASLVEPMIDGDWITVLPWGIDVALFALLGMPTYVCASGATPLVAILLHKGVSPGAAVAFLLAGPATNLTTFGVLADMHGRRIAIVFAAAMAAMAIGLGLVVNGVLPDARGLALHESGHQDVDVLPVVCLSILAVVFALSVMRSGPRRFVGHVFASHSDDHGHAHGHAHGHTHSHAHGHDGPEAASHSDDHSHADGHAHGHDGSEAASHSDDHSHRARR